MVHLSCGREVALPLRLVLRKRSDAHVVYILYSLCCPSLQSSSAVPDGQLRCNNLAAFRFDLLDGLLFLVVDHSLFLEVFHLIARLAFDFLDAIKDAYPAMRAVPLENLIRGSACLCRTLPSLLGIYAVEDVVPVETFEEGISRFVTLLPCRFGGGYECAIGCLLGARIAGGGG